jgi:hypothetical protein
MVQNCLLPLVELRMAAAWCFPDCFLSTSCTDRCVPRNHRRWREAGARVARDALEVFCHVAEDCEASIGSHELTGKMGGLLRSGSARRCSLALQLQATALLCLLMQVVW